MPWIYTREASIVFNTFRSHSSVAYNYGANTIPVLPLKNLRHISILMFENNYIEALQEIEKTLGEFKSINTKGFINDMNLYNYDHLRDGVDFILNADYFNKKNMLEIKGKTTYLGDKVLPIKDSMELYKWSYNLTILELLKLSEYAVSRLNEIQLSTGVDSVKEGGFAASQQNTLIDFKVLCKELFHSLEPSIRSKLTRKGMSIIQNIYTGFDTEYCKKDSMFNELLSVQLSTCCKSIIVLPYQDRDKFLLNEIDVLTGKELPNTDKVSTYIDKDNLTNYILGSVNIIRDLKFAAYDYSMNKMIEALKSKKDEQDKDDNSTDKKDIKITSYFKMDDRYVFVFERSNIKQKFIICNEYNFTDMVKMSNNAMKDDLRNDLDRIKNTLIAINSNDLKISLNHEEEINVKSLNNLDNKKYELENLATSAEEINESSGASYENSTNYEDVIHKKYTRSSNTSYTNERVSVTKKVNNFMLAHNTPADLSMFKDFESFRKNVDIVNKSFVSLKDPILIDGVNVWLRDTMLITPGGKKSLEAVSNLYKGIDKIKISKDQIENMKQFMQDDPVLFKSYALQDSLISLIHGCYMEEFNHSLNRLGIPVTLSSLSSSFVRLYWDENLYKGYQLSHKYLLSNASKSLTPKGLSVLKDVGVKSTMYIANYKGGRNESYMYGYENTTKWYDIDIKGAYPTVMRLLGCPDYEHAMILDPKKFQKSNWETWINSYTILSVNFEFPENVKYPSIPCNLDETTTVYPLKGSAYITSLDYSVAIKQNAKIFIKEVFVIPFKYPKSDKNNINKKASYIRPFDSCIQTIQKNRSKFQKGTLNNALWKEIGNSIYGLVVRGLNEKLKFNSRTGDMTRMEGNDLSNPIIACYITSFIRCIIGELLHVNSLLGGKAVSATTDGLITNIENLEDKACEYFKKNWKGKSILLEFKKIIDNQDAIEVKNEGKGIMSWCTRGQLSTDSSIFAATGFQKGNLSLEEVYELFLEKFKEDNKELYFIQNSLRSGKDIYKHGGNVTNVYSDKVFRLLYDNKRLIDENDKIDNLYDSKPLNSVDESSLIRYMAKLPRTKQYTINSGSAYASKYKNSQDLMIRNFLRALLADQLNLKSNVFKTYKDIIDFLKGFDKTINYSENSISQLKRRGKFVKVRKMQDASRFVDYILEKFPDFNHEEFFK